MLQINAYAPENQIDMVHFAIEVCADVIEFYNKFFGIEFPMKKMGNNSLNVNSSDTSVNEIF